MKRDYTQLKGEFTEWYGLSEKERLSRGLPKDITNFSKTNAVSTQSLHLWIKGISGNGETEDFDPKNYIDANLEKLLKKLIAVASGEKGTAKHLELALKIAGLLVEKREDTLKVEYSSGEIARDADEIIGYLQQRLKEAGTCPVCEKPSILLAEVCDNQES